MTEPRHPPLHNGMGSVRASTSPPRRILMVSRATRSHAADALKEFTERWARTQ